MAPSPAFIVRVTGSVFQVLGLILTAFRIYFRLRIGRFWWEDAWAVVSLLSGLIWITAMWTLLLTGDVLTSIVVSWTYSIAFTCTTMAVRMSILYSIIRIVDTRTRLRKFTHVCTAFFAACWVILIAAKIWHCTSDRSWHHVSMSYRKPFCSADPSISVFKFATDCIAISILVVLPLRMLWKVKLPRRQRRMILSIFASSIVIAFGALFHTLGQTLHIYIATIIGVNTEIALSLIVCNMLVVVTCTYRFLLHDNESSGDTEHSAEATSAADDDFTLPTRSHSITQNLTTIDLDLAS
ncbi:hypothetical protein BS17DRAFT_759335 [Gyrodon lividus]|nr:hypothetical protein BS17DRAFT_759335 [Gyrodon lividus]